MSVKCLLSTRQHTNKVLFIQRDSSPKNCVNAAVIFLSVKPFCSFTETNKKSDSRHVLLRATVVTKAKVTFSIQDSFNPGLQNTARGVN